MKILFFGSSDYAYVCLNTLTSIYDVIGIITQPDRPGKNHKVEPTYVKRKMAETDIPIFTPLDVNTEYDLIKSLSPDMIFTAAYGQILSKKILNIPKYGSINIHASYLPAYRGASPIRQTIIDGCKTTGITSIYMDEKVDAGKIIIQEEIKIEEDETFGSLYEKFLNILPEFTVKTVESVISGNKGIAQPKESNYAHKNTSADTYINWQDPCVNIDRQVRAFSPVPGVHCKIGTRDFKIYEVKPIDVYHNNEPGTVVRIEKDFLRIACGKGYIDVYKIQIPGKNILNTRDFINGNKLWLNEIKKSKKIY